MWKRFDLARQIGCDGIEPAHNDVSIYTSGFTIPSEDTYSWYAAVATQGHDRKLSTGMVNGDRFTDAGALKFDWLLIERCGEGGISGFGCDPVRTFTDLDKAVLAVDYDMSLPDPDDNNNKHAQTAAALCPIQVTARIQDGLFKDVGLTSSVRTPCNP